MATDKPTFRELRLQATSSKVLPVYLLQGEEGYYIDELVKAFESSVAEEERDFNLTVLYAPQVSPEQVSEACLRYPMMAERQVVILKEAHAVSADYFEKLLPYLDHPNPTTVFVIAARGAKVKSSAFVKAVPKAGVVFESPKLYERQVSDTLVAMIKEAGLTIEAKALALMVDHIGTSLSKMVNEVAKLKTALPAGAAVTPRAVEALIGINKDFNNFELIDAVASRNAVKSYQIIDYFRKNPKNNPSILTGIALFGFFAKLIQAHYAPKPLTESSVAGAIGARAGSPEMRRIMMALQSFSARQCITAISACRRFDTRAKGIDSRANEYDLLQELLFTILH